MCIKSMFDCIMMHLFKFNAYILCYVIFESDEPLEN